MHTGLKVQAFSQLIAPSDNLITLSGLAAQKYVIVCDSS
jgi:hypothetical protein